MTGAGGRTGIASCLLVTAIVLLIAIPAGCTSALRSRVRDALERAGSPETEASSSWVQAGTTEEEVIAADAEGQWAVAATASSSLGERKELEGWRPAAATGAPDAVNEGWDPRTWAPAWENAGYEWIELEYAVPVHATGVRVREIWGCGCVVMVELRDTGGASHVVWAGRDRPDSGIWWLALEFPPTPYLAEGVRVTLDTTLNHGWKQIDAVQLSGAP